MASSSDEWFLAIFPFSILMFGEEAVCPDGLFVPAVFRESDFYVKKMISHKNPIPMKTSFFASGQICPFGLSFPSLFQNRGKFAPNFSPLIYNSINI